MTHSLSINNRAFQAIINLTKRVELRVNTGKKDYSKISKGDIIEFKNSNGELINCRVMENNWYESAEKLLITEGTRYTLSSTNDIDEGINSLSKFEGYAEGIKKNGIFAIHLELLNKYHYMKLESKYFNFIKNGTKRIELRLNDEKRKIIKLGDYIEFSKLNSNSEKITVQVVGLLNYPTFNELINDFNEEILADKSVSKKELIQILSNFYTHDEEEKLGVIGIKIKLI